jgi:Nucleotide-sugar transporter
MLYFVPAFMYCLYNNLAFVNLATFDPTTYYLLLQFRVVITGIVFQVSFQFLAREWQFSYRHFSLDKVLFKKQLSCKQWISLLLLTVGCMIKHIDIGNSGHEATKGTDKASESSFSREISTLFILVQVSEGNQTFACILYYSFKAIYIHILTRKCEIKKI